MENNKRIQSAINILKCFNAENKFYWLNELIKQGHISQSEAGYIITVNG